MAFTANVCARKQTIPLYNQCLSSQNSVNINTEVMLKVGIEYR